MQVRALPPLQPLVVVLKALLKEAALNEPYTGGLSSCSLVWVVYAHLQSEGIAAGLSSSSSGSSDASRCSATSNALRKRLQSYLTELAGSSAAAAVSGICSSSHVSDSQDVDLGVLLLTCLLRVCQLIDFEHEAVSVADGGIIPKPQRWCNPERPRALAVLDPTPACRDLAQLSWALDEFSELFGRSAASICNMPSDKAPQAPQLLVVASAPANTVEIAGSARGVAAARAGWGQNALTPVQPSQQQQELTGTRQQLQHGFCCLEKVLDVWAALGRSHAANMH